MQLSLLVPPTDSPFRLPLARGFPSESSFAVDPSALPRQLPQAILDPNFGTAPYEALARLGATGQKISEDTLNLLLHAEAKKRDADDLAEATGLYTQTALKVDEEFEQLKTSSDHHTLRPAFDQLWKQRASEALAQAPNDRVRQHLALKLAGFRLTKSAEVSDVTRRKFVDYHEATLIDSAKALVKQATDPEATPPETDFAIRNLESLFRGYAATGIFPADKLSSLRERVLTTTYNELARQAMTKDPAAFLPKDSDENGQDGFRAFTNRGRYPADPKYLDTLLERAPRLQEHQATQVRLAQERRQQALDKAMDLAANKGYDDLMNDLTSGDAAKVTAASARVIPYIQAYGSFLSSTQKNEMRDLARKPSLVGGVTDDVTYNSLSARIHEFPGSVPEDEIRRARLDGKLQATGDRSSQALIDKQRQLLKGDDISQRPDYAVGRSLITTGLGSGITDMTAAQFKALRPENIAEHDLWRSRALEEYDRKARSEEWQKKDLRELGAQVRDAYFKIIYDRAVGEIRPPAPRSPTPSADNPREGKTQTKPPTPATTGPASWLDYLLPKPFVAPSP